MPPRKNSKKSSTRIPFDIKDPDHQVLISDSVSDNEELKNQQSSKSKHGMSQKKRKRNTSNKESTQKKKKLRSEISQFRGSTILFGEDDNTDPSELDEHGNIKDLIDYSDPQEYEIYEKEMKKREQKEQKMMGRPHIIFSKKKLSESENESEDDSEEKSDNDDYEDVNIENHPMGIIIPYLLGEEQPEDSLSRFQTRIMNSNLSDACKQLVLKRLENCDPDKPKLIEWIESLLNIPFGKLAISPVTINDPLSKIQSFFNQTIEQFDKNVYGITSVKQQIIDYLGQFIAAGSDSCPRTLALCGGPGIGKTYLVRHGLADALGRPLRVVNMGGIKDSAHMCGFEYSYANARYGVIAQILMEKQVMNPIILFEEVDKISETRDGQDIQNILMHLTDPEQNKAFQDKYFAGIDIDISKAILVFTLNDPSVLSPILLNRLHLVMVPDPTREDRIQIAKRHMIPQIFKSVNMSADSVMIPEEICGYILDRYSQNDKGLRTFKGCLETIMLRLNTIRLIGRDLSGKLQLKFPVILTSEIVDSILKTSVRNNSNLFMYL